MSIGLCSRLQFPEVSRCPNSTLPCHIIPNTPGQRRPSRFGETHRVVFRYVGNVVGIDGNLDVENVLGGVVEGAREDSIDEVSTAL